MEFRTRIIIGSLGIALVLAGIIFGIKSCQPRTKILKSDEVYGAFINANIDFTCQLLKDPLLASDQEKAKQQVKKVYEKYRLPVEDNAQMLKILEKYENDPEVISIVQTNTEPCVKGSNPIFYQTAVK